MANKFNWGDQYRSHNNPYGLEEQEIYAKPRALTGLAEVESLHPTDVINSIGHAGDRAAAARLKSLIGPEFSNSMITEAAKTPGRLSKWLKIFPMEALAGAHESSALTTGLKSLAKGAL